MRLPGDRRGQAAIVDAILFMTIMLVASAVIFGSGGSEDYRILEYSSGMQYADDFASTLLAVELAGVGYTNVTGEPVEQNGTRASIGRLICDEAIILGGGVGQSNFSQYEERIREAGNILIRPGMEYAVSCGDGIFISRASELPPERFASQMAVASGTGESVTVTVYVWVA